MSLYPVSAWSPEEIGGCLSPAGKVGKLRQGGHACSHTGGCGRALRRYFSHRTAVALPFSSRRAAGTWDSPGETSAEGESGPHLPITSSSCHSSVLGASLQGGMRDLGCGMQDALPADKPDPADPQAAPDLGAGAAPRTPAVAWWGLGVQPVGCFWAPASCAERGTHPAVLGGWQGAMWPVSPLPPCPAGSFTSHQRSTRGMTWNTVTPSLTQWGPAASCWVPTSSSLGGF